MYKKLFLITITFPMKSIKIFSAKFFIVIFIFTTCKKDYIHTAETRINNDIIRKTKTSLFTMPAENKPHEGTWLQWPHQFTYGFQYRNRIEPTWVAMTKELVQSEKVHIVAYNNSEKNRISNKLISAGISLTNIDFKIFPTNDCWVRDNGPIFVYNSSDQLYIEDWGFNGWGTKAPYKKDDKIPCLVSNAISIPVVDLNTTFTVEGGAMEIDGNGVFMGTRSSILNSNRNPGVSQAQAESILGNNIGISKFIWLDGFTSVDDITDCHIDGFAKFANANTIVTMDSLDLWYWYLSPADISTLYAATNTNNKPYKFVYLPLTKNDVITAYGKNLGYKGSYVNYYIANTKILIPFYKDPNDNVAKNIIQKLYPGKTAVGVDVRNLYEQGGMIHCVTQQQPVQ